MTFGSLEGQFGYPAFPPCSSPVGAGPGGFVDENSRDLVGAEACRHKALLTSHTGAHENDCVSVPIRTAAYVVDRAGVSKVHVQEVRSLAVSISDGLVVPRYSRSL